MNAHFFKQIFQMDFAGVLQLVIKPSANGQWLVSAVLDNENCTDEAKRLIPPLLLKGTAEELDEGFFENLKPPIEKTSALLLNMEAYLAQQEQARKQSAREKEEAQKQNKEKQNKEKKYNEAMQKVADLEGQGKYREAWAKLPQIKDFPQYEDAIKKRKDELMKYFVPELFTS